MPAKTILILDDDKAFRQLLVPRLEAQGFAVLQAARVTEASALLAQAPDLILVDGLLPDGSGISWIQSLPLSARKKPIVFCSAFFKGMKEHQRLVRELGVTMVVHKPIDAESLVGQLAQLLGKAVQQPLPAEMAAEMAILRSEYEVLLRDKLKALLTAIEAARKQPSSEALREEARSQAHRLSGTAGSYGFHDESTAAQVAEAQILAAPLVNGPEQVDRCWAAAEGAVADVMLDRAMAGHTSDPS